MLLVLTRRRRCLRQWRRLRRWQWRRLGRLRRTRIRARTPAIGSSVFHFGMLISIFLAIDRGSHGLFRLYPQARRIIIQKKREPVSFISRKALDCLYHHETKTTHALTIYKGFYISKKGERYFSFRGTANCPDSPAGMKLNASYNMCVPEGTGQRYGIFS